MTEVHSTLIELERHLESELAAVRADKPDFEAWAAADKLRGTALAHLEAQHAMYHLIDDGTVQIDLRVAQMLLRIAGYIEVLEERLASYEEGQ